MPVASVLLAIGGVSAYWPPSTVPDSTSVADELRPATWAMTVPSAWLVTPVPPVRRDDAIDILAMRAGDKGYSIPVAYGVRVLLASDRGLLLEVDETDATAIATARGSGYQLVPLLRSTR